MHFTKLALIASLTLAPAAILAQSAAAPASTPTTTAPVHRTINQRKENQQDRIAQGINKGTLSAGEAAHLEKQESAINREEHNMRAQDNGHLTKADRRLINKQQNQESRRIYRTKHDIGHK